MSSDDEVDFEFVRPKPNAGLSRRYKQDPTVKNYLKLRRENPNEEIEVAVTGGMDWLFTNEQQLLAHEIEPELVASVLDADLNAISMLSLILLEKLVERDELIQSGKSHVISRGEAISDALVNYLSAMMLDALSWNNDLTIPRDLIVLQRRQLLKTDTPALTRHQESEELKKNVALNAALLLEQTGKISMRNLANMLGVNVSTISRMFKGQELENEAKDILEQYRKSSNSQTPFADQILKKTNPE